MIHFLIDQRLRTKQVEEQGDRSNLTDISASVGNQQTASHISVKDMEVSQVMGGTQNGWFIRENPSINGWFIWRIIPNWQRLCLGCDFSALCPKSHDQLGWHPQSTGYPINAPVRFFSPRCDFQCIDEWIDQWSMRTTTVPMDNHYGYPLVI